MEPLRRHREEARVVGIEREIAQSGNLRREQTGCEKGKEERERFCGHKGEQRIGSSRVGLR